MIQLIEIHGSDEKITLAQSLFAAIYHRVTYRSIHDSDIGNRHINRIDLYRCMICVRSDAKRRTRSLLSRHLINDTRCV